MAKKWSEIDSISTANDTHEFVVIEAGFSKRISKLNFLKELASKDASQDSTISGLSSSVSANANNIAINSSKTTTLENITKFTSEFVASSPDVLTTEGSYINTHATLPFGLSGAVVRVAKDKHTGKLWQILTPTTGETSEGYRIQNTTVGTWLEWIETNPELTPEFLGVSLATNQQAPATDTAIQIEFGVAQTGSNGNADLAVDGTVTFIKSGLFRVRVSTHFGRLGSTGVSLIFGRFLHNGVQYGSTTHARIDNADVLRPFSNSFTILVASGDTLVMQSYRDSAGNDSGGLFSAQPALAGWALSPSASISVTKV